MLIAQNNAVQLFFGRSNRFGLALAYQPQVSQEQAPNHRGEQTAQGVPSDRIRQIGECDRFHQSTGDVEKIMSELQWPAYQGQRVCHRPGPEQQNHEQAVGYVRPLIETEVTNRRSGALSQYR